MAVMYAQGDGVTSSTEGSDTIYGNELSNSLYGNGGNDRLYGGAGNDFLSDSRGRDVLAGGEGYDDFYFGASGRSKASLDVITDFNKRFDAIVLSKFTFTGIGTANKWMKPTAFWSGSKAHDSNDRIIHNSKTGFIYFDPDGTGSKAAIPFAKIKAGLKLAASDFWVDY